MWIAAAEGEESEQAQEPLLPGLGGEDDDGSVGSEDTTDDDSEADEAARLVDDALAGLSHPGPPCCIATATRGCHWGRAYLTSRNIMPLDTASVPEQTE